LAALRVSVVSTQPLEHLEKYVGKKIEFRFDQRNVTRLLTYTCSSETEPARFIGVLKAQDLHQLQISLAELNWMKGKLDREGREVNNYSILAIYAERLGRVDILRNASISYESSHFN